MKFIFLLAVFLFCSIGFAYDCANVAPFVPAGGQNIRVGISRFKWSQGEAGFEEICISDGAVHWYDVRGREEDAYYCLKPLNNEVLVCDTRLDGDEAEIHIVPSSWIRSWKPFPRRDYLFHAYVIKKNDPDFYYDIYSRSLSTDLNSQSMIVEGALKTGPHNPDDGFWVRLEFL